MAPKLIILTLKTETKPPWSVAPPAGAAARSLQSCPTLCDPIDSSLPGSLVPGILQARTLEWVAISFSNAWKWKVKVKSLSRVWLFTAPWAVAHQAPPSMGFSRQEYWNGVPSPSPENAYIFALFLLLLLSYISIPDSSVGNESTCNAGDPVQFLGREDLLEKG